VLRSIRAVARDRDWATVPVEVLESTETDAAMVLRLRMQGLGADLEAGLRVAARGERLMVSVDAISATDFLRNRIGLVVLHPPSVAAAPFAVVTSDGRRTAAAFPSAIRPHQPAVDIARLEWAVDGLVSSLEFFGEIFEMEDQRNGTDASFKTYSTPLSLPFPVRVAAGQRITQSLILETSLTALARAARTATRAAERIMLELANWPVPAVLVGEHPPRRIHPRRWSGPRPTRSSHVTELNRNAHRLPAELPALTFSVTPQMHATERAQILESVAMQREVAMNALRLAGGRPILVGPVTLRPRYNAVATSEPPASDDLSAGYGAELFDATDPRQASTALAAWTIASAVAFAMPGIAAVAWFARW
jgi:hypothetical protein